MDNSALGDFKFDNLKHKPFSVSQDSSDVFTSKDMENLIVALATKFGNVSIDENNDEVNIGGAVKLNKREIQKLIGNEKKKQQSSDDITHSSSISNDCEEHTNKPLKKQFQSGKNAFEIRNDIMRMAMDFSLTYRKDATPQQVVEIAKIFYSFVENRTR